MPSKAPALTALIDGNSCEPDDLSQALNCAGTADHPPLQCPAEGFAKEAERPSIAAEFGSRNRPAGLPEFVLNPASLTPGCLRLLPPTSKPTDIAIVLEATDPLAASEHLPLKIRLWESERSAAQDQPAVPESHLIQQHIETSMPANNRPRRAEAAKERREEGVHAAGD